MKNELVRFENEIFGGVRCLDIEGKCYFVGKDVAEVLGYTRSDNMYKIVDKTDKIMVNPQTLGITGFEGDFQKLQNPESVENTGFLPEGAPQSECGVEDNGNILLESNPNIKTMILITESGLYDAVFSSKLDKAKAFRRWVTKEVLPSLRQKGYYALENRAVQLEGRITELEQVNRLALENNNMLEQKIEDLQSTCELLKEERDDLLEGINYVSTPAPRSAIKYNVRSFLKNFCYETTKELIPCRQMYELFLSATASTGVTCSRSIFEDVMYELNKRICYEGNVRKWDYTGVHIEKIRNL